MKPAFPKIFAIGTDYIQSLFDGPVEVTEKVDGSQFGFGLVDGQPVFRSKGKQIFPEAPEKMFQVAVDYANNMLASSPMLPENIFFYCEYLKTPKHNTLTYDRIPKNNLALFGVVTDVDTFENNHDEIVKWADVLGIEAVPLLERGQISHVEDVKDLLEKDSFLGGPKIEGVVVKNYAQPFLLGGQPIPLMAGKFVSEKFKELHKVAWKSNTGPGIMEVFMDGFRTEARWEKAVQHLRENGNLLNDPKDIGNLIKEVDRDIHDEEIDYIKDRLYSLHKKEISRRATRGLPEWYKNKLMERSFIPVDSGT